MITFLCFRHGSSLAQDDGEGHLQGKGRRRCGQERGQHLRSRCAGDTVQTNDRIVRLILGLTQIDRKKDQGKVLTPTIDLKII